MKPTLNEIMLKLSNWNNYNPFEHPLESILKNIKREQYLYKEELISQLNKVIEDKNEEILNDLISICFYDGVDKSFTLALNQLLLEDWHECHEDIASLIEKIRDIRSVEVLYQRILKIPEDDDMRALAKKCIWALKAINTPEAIDKLILLQDSDDSIIRDNALL